MNFYDSMIGDVFMGERRINPLLIFFALIGAAVGTFFGELILENLLLKIPTILVVGLYFGVLALFIGLMCLLAEMISPSLNGIGWRKKYVGSSWKYLVPLTFILLFVSSMILQFFYQLDFGSFKRVKDVVLLIDCSPSMTQTDPDNARLRAAKNLVREMKDGNRVSVITFSDEAKVIQPMVNIESDKTKTDINRKISKIKTITAQSGTATGNALKATMKEIKKTYEKDRGAMVIFLSDGEPTDGSENRLSELVQPYNNKNITINTVAMLIKSEVGTRVLKDIAADTDGTFYDVSNTDEITGIFKKIYLNGTERTLITPRTGKTEHSTVYAVLRIVFVGILMFLLALGIGLMFDNKYITKGFSIGGIIGGITAGIIIEYCYTIEYRYAASLIFALIFTLCSLSVKFKQDFLRVRDTAGDRRSIYKGNGDNFKM
jgi:Ca-activated chloride channel family protein